MKTFIYVSLLAALLAPRILSGQGITYVSNLESASIGSRAVASDSWFATYFRTGPNAGGYQLNSVELLMDQPSGVPSGFTVSLYSLNGSLPGDNIGNLIGGNPTAPGVYQFVYSGVALSSLTGYFVVASAASSGAQGSYEWKSNTGSGAFLNNGWILGQGLYQSNSGTGWALTRVPGLQYAVNATPVPEPSSLALLCLSSLIMGAFFWRRAKADL